MENDCVEIIAMGESNIGSKEKHEALERGTGMVCFVGMHRPTQSGFRPSGPKPRYKQSYREAWESMRDFKGWLTSVPGNTSKAYCRLCQKELHCHRLSLLKHKVTYKHQRKEEELKLLGFHEEHKVKSQEVNNFLNENCEQNNKNFTLTKYEMEDKSNFDDQPTTSEISDIAIQKNKEENPAWNSGLSTHVLDTSKGLPAASIHVVLYKLIEGRWTLIHEGLTNLEGRYNFSSQSQEFLEGRYKLHYDVGEYFEKQNLETIFPFIEVAFNVKKNSSHYHIPLILTPYGYSIYKGS